ncbi:MAG: hypothetical protein K0S56_2403 [Microvirga sp.]|nr:hypothetical protein [Microvirga sp.]
MVAVIRVDAQLIDYFETVLAPVPDVDEREVERCAIIAGKVIALAKSASSGENIGSDDLVY